MVIVQIPEMTLGLFYGLTLKDAFKNSTSLLTLLFEKAVLTHLTTVRKHRVFFFELTLVTIVIIVVVQHYCEETARFFRLQM